jgi:uncharacterized protein
MNRIFSILIVIFTLTITMSAQNDETLTDGYKIFKYPNGAISSEGIIRNGKPDGFWKSYYVTGIKKSEGKRSNFLLDSIWIFYDQTGDTIEKINYLYGKKNGYYYTYKKDPVEGIYIWSRELYAGDIKEGTGYIYFPDGKINQVMAYRNGKKEGLSKEFDKNGNLITLLEYNNDFLISRDRINRSDSKGLKQGDWKDFYPNGTIKTERTFKDDQLHGYYKEYDNKGNLVLTMLYENGSIVKSRVDDAPDIQVVDRHDQSGRLIYRGPFRNNIPVGIHQEFGADGKVTNSKIYNDNGLLLSEGIVDLSGNKNGKWKDYFANGKIQAEGQYTENRRTGQWKFYNEQEKVEQTGSFNNGRPDGMWKWYYENGSLLREEEYFQGQRDGTYTEYSRTGEIIAQGQYSDGEMNGDWKYKSGNFIEEGKYITGLRDGQWKAYFADGKIRFKGSFVQGNPDGIHIFYNENGTMKEERHYQMGIRDKTWKKYDDDGNLVLTIAYKDDMEYSINGVRIKLPESDVKLIK